LMSPGVSSLDDLSWNQAHLLHKQRKKRSSIIEKDYRGQMDQRRIKCLNASLFFSSD
jgi:hypothetical protein